MVPDAFTTRALLLYSSTIERTVETLLSIPCFLRWRDMHLSSNWIVELFWHWRHPRPKGEKVNRLWISWSSTGIGLGGGTTSVAVLWIAVGMTDDDDDMITGTMLDSGWHASVDSKNGAKSGSPRRREIHTKIAFNSPILDQCRKEGYQKNRLNWEMFSAQGDSLTGEEMMKVSFILCQWTVHEVENGATKSDCWYQNVHTWGKVLESVRFDNP